MSTIGIQTSQNVPSHPQERTANNLLKQLLDCVKQCQRRFGGKNELATEHDSCVAGLCLCLEAVFLHGLRTKPLSTTKPHNNSTLKQVSDIVVNSLHIGQEEHTTYWPFILRHLINHERERFNLLKNIWTNTGKSKAWIRASLNEKSLERYCNTVLSDKLILSEYYENWALLRDEEKNSLLPNMAAGLGSILFAIVIDKPEFNTSFLNTSETIHLTSEPVIEPPIRDNDTNRNKHLKKSRKVARQFISFDENNTMLSTSGAPSDSSGSTCSETSSSAAEIHPQQPKQQQQQQDAIDHVLEKVIPNKSTRKISIESSGSRGQFSAELPETLMPINPSDIGELTPVSVETKDFKLPPDEILEVPTDISAVLTVVENRNLEEIRKRDDKILLLTKENEALNKQVKQFIDALRILKSDNDTVQTVLENLQIDQDQLAEINRIPEEKIYEEKLVQVAEMHAELIDFNVMLQQTLVKKEVLLERMKKELEELRGPISLDEFTSDSNIHGNVNIWIPSAFLTGSGSNSHHVYQIYLKAGNDEWNIYRRYAQFYALHTDLKKLDPAVRTFDFPPKKSIGKKDSTLVEERRKRLQIYLRRVVAHWPELAQCNSRFLLEQHLAFFK